MSDIDTWWKRNLDDYRDDGRMDAEKGIFDPPHYVTDCDPQYTEENQAYKEGFMERRKSLGKSFKWR